MEHVAIREIGDFAEYLNSLRFAIDSVWVMINCDYSVDVTYRIHRRAPTLKEQREAFEELGAVHAQGCVYVADDEALPNLFLVYAAHNNPGVTFVVVDRRCDSLAYVCEYKNVRVIREHEGKRYEVRRSAKVGDWLAAARLCTCKIYNDAMHICVAGLTYKARACSDWYSMNGAKVEWLPGLAP